MAIEKKKEKKLTKARMEVYKRKEKEREKPYKYGEVARKEIKELQEKEIIEIKRRTLQEKYNYTDIS